MISADNSDIVIIAGLTPAVLVKKLRFEKTDTSFVREVDTLAATIMPVTKQDFQTQAAITHVRFEGFIQMLSYGTGGGRPCN